MPLYVHAKTINTTVEIAAAINVLGSCVNA